MSSITKSAGVVLKLGIFPNRLNIKYIVLYITSVNTESKHVKQRTNHCAKTLKRTQMSLMRLNRRTMEHNNKTVSPTYNSAEQQTSLRMSHWDLYKELTNNNIMPFVIQVVIGIFRYHAFQLLFYLL